MPKIKVENSQVMNALINDVMPLLSKFAGSMGATARRQSFSKAERAEFEKVALLRDALTSYEGQDKAAIQNRAIHGSNLGGFFTGLTGVGASKLQNILDEFDEHLLEGTQPPKVLPDGFTREATAEERAEGEGMHAAKEETRRVMEAQQRQMERERAEGEGMHAAKEETRRVMEAQQRQMERERAEGEGMHAAEEETRRVMEAQQRQRERERAERVLSAARTGMGAADIESQKFEKEHARREEIAKDRAEARQKNEAAHDTALEGAARMFEAAEKRAQRAEDRKAREEGRDSALEGAAHMFEAADEALAIENFYKACADGTVKSKDIEKYAANKDVIYEGFCRAAENGKTVKLAGILEKANLGRLEKDQLASRAFVRCYKTGNFSCLSYLKGMTKNVNLKDKMQRPDPSLPLSREQIERFNIFDKAMDVVIQAAKDRESKQLYTPNKRRPGTRNSALPSR